jgi:quercetin dioxygenase-like cupin family protein
MNDLPFNETLSNKKRIRIFNENVDDDELKWHRDRENRMVKVIQSNGWELQMDDELPKLMNNGDTFIIPEGVYHRIIKGTGDLKVEIEFID